MTATTIAIEIPPAIIAYSMAVAPVSAEANFRMDLSMRGLASTILAFDGDIMMSLVPLVSANAQNGGIVWFERGNIGSEISKTLRN